MSIKQKLTVEDDFSKTFDKFNQKAKQVDNATKSMDLSLKKVGSSYTSSIGSMAVGAVSFAAVTKYIMDGVKANNWKVESDKRLEAIARSVTSATDSQIDSLKALAEATQLRTTQEAESVKVGQSQLLSFGMSTKSAEKLNGAMSDLAAAQFGLGVKGRDLIGVANMLGKAYQGMDGAISRAGVTMTDAQKQALKLGNESERVAVISEVIAQNFGGLAEALAQTDAGKIEMMKHDLGDLQEALTAGLLPILGTTGEYVSAISLSLSEAVNETNLLGMSASAIIHPLTGIAVVADGIVSTLAVLPKLVGLAGKKLERFMTNPWSSDANADRISELDKEIEATEKAVNSITEGWTNRTAAAGDYLFKIQEGKKEVREMTEAEKKLLALKASLGETTTGNTKSKTEEKKVDYSKALESLREYAVEENRVIWENRQKQKAAEARMASASLEESIKATEAKNAITQQETEFYLQELDKRKLAEESTKQLAIQSAFDISKSVQSIASSNSSIRLAEISREEEAIRKSTMSDRQKAKALEELEKKRRAETLKSAKVQAAFNLSVAAAQVPLAIIDAQLVALRAMRDGVGGVAARTAQGLSMLAIGMGFVGQIKSAQASIAGAREFGGGTMAGNSYEIGERGKPEVIENASGKFIFNPSQASKVTPIADSGMGSKISYNTFNVYESGDANVTAKTIVSLLNQVDRDGSMDWGGMKNLKRAVA